MIKSLARTVLRAMPLSWSRAIRYRYYAGTWPHLRHPVGLSEKLNWRILHDHRDIWNWCADKLESKRHASLRSPGILMPTVLWSGTDLSEIADLEVSGRWILKSNSSSKDVVAGTGQPDIAALERVVGAWDDYQSRVLGEYAYRFARRIAVLEQWITDSESPPHDYKVMVFDGIARYVHVHTDRFTDHRASLYTRDWVRINARQDHVEPSLSDLPRPDHLDEILRRAEEIGAGFDHVRVDLFDTPEGVWFGEVTPYSWSGFRPFRPEAVEVELGDQWTLPELASPTMRPAGSR